jgi:hypothetical protein
VEVGYLTKAGYRDVEAKFNGRPRQGPVHLSRRQSQLPSGRSRQGSRCAGRWGLGLFRDSREPSFAHVGLVRPGCATG